MTEMTVAFQLFDAGVGKVKLTITGIDAHGTVYGGPTIILTLESAEELAWQLLRWVNSCNTVTQ